MVPCDRGAGLTQLKPGACLRCLAGDLSACPPVRGRVRLRSGCDVIDTPGAQMSSCGLVEGGSVGPGGVFVIGGSVFEAAVEDAHESVGEGS